MSNSQQIGLVYWIFSIAIFAFIYGILPLELILHDLLIMGVYLLLLGVIWPISWLKQGKRVLSYGGISSY